MHDTARRGLVRLIGGVAGVAGIVFLVLLILRSCRSDEERLRETVDDARDALVEHRADDFLAFFAEDVTYRHKQARKDLERDLARWNEFKLLRITIQEAAIDVTGREASIRLRCDAGDIFRTYQTVAVELHAEKREGAWLVTSFDWK
ncbi:MAG: hypothetical protein K8T90_00645 [Planctomycetes bacterium]|nr:hypothetical protein [Planctomycetota bacterium]